MKVVKLRQSDLKKPVEDLLRKLGAVKGKLAFPNCVYMNTNDYKVLTRNMVLHVKKAYPNLRKNKVDYTVGMIMLNLGPNTSLGDAIKPGYVLIDEEGLK